MISKLIKTSFYLLILLLPSFILAQDFSEELVLNQDEIIQESYHAEVLDIVDVKREILPPSNVEYVTQTLNVKILDGDKKGELIVFDNDFRELEKGDKIFLNHAVLPDGYEYYTVREVDRLLPILILVITFSFVVVFFGGMQGVRSLLSLVGSLFIIVYVLIPTLLAGYSPVLMSILISTAVLFMVIFFVHGFNVTSFISFIGTISAVIFTGLSSVFFINITKLTGFSSDETVYLHLNTGGGLDIKGLLLASVIIGALGVLDDIAITQVSVVKELFKVDNNLSIKNAYDKALRVGKDHISALINTLVLAYTGAALPLLLLYFQSSSSVLFIVNKEIFATEIVRALVGSMGLILAVPITTWLAVSYFSKK